MKSDTLKKMTVGPHTFHVRPGTSDENVIHGVFNLQEYNFPEFDPSLEPKNILDIGGNIGVTAVLLTQLYPKANIFSFEPDPENFAILCKNIKPYSKIRGFNCGLGSDEATGYLYDSDDEHNFGGRSLYKKGVNLSKGRAVELKNINNVLKDMRVEHVELIKIDTEGAEADILMTLDPDILASVNWIAGELHGQKDWELLRYLEDAGFSLQVEKPLEDRNYQFHAGRMGE